MAHASSAISRSPIVLLLSEKLEKGFGDFGVLKRVFIDHFRKDFARTFLQEELSRVSQEPSHVVYDQVGRVRFAVINNLKFDYTLQLARSTDGSAPSLQWSGNSQILGVKGKGVVTVRILSISKGISVDRFSRNAELITVEERDLSEGEVVSCEGPNRLIQIVSVHGLAMLESLTIKRDSNLTWTFDRNDLKPIAATTATPFSSRLKMLLDIAVMQKNLPYQLLDAIFETTDVRLKLETIQAMMLNHDESAFDRLHEGVASSDELFSNGCRSLLDEIIGTNT